MNFVNTKAECSVNVAAVAGFSRSVANSSMVCGMLFKVSGSISLATGCGVLCRLKPKGHIALAGRAHQGNFDSTMSAVTAQILQQAMLLPWEDRTELVEAILEQSQPTDEFIQTQMEIVSRRMEQVRVGQSRLIPAEEAHAAVLARIEASA